MRNAVHYSRGANKFDNQPEQHQAESFDAFTEAVLNDRASEKGQQYICAAFEEGVHSDPGKNPGVKTWRQEHLVQQRDFLPLDCDGFNTHDSYIRLLEWMEPFQGFGYTTASHTADSPRCRMVLAQTRPTTRMEGIRLGKAVQQRIERDLGPAAIKFDPSVYRAEQPLFTPLHSSQVFRFFGAPIDVDTLLAEAPADDLDALTGSSGRALEIAHADPVYLKLHEKSMLKAEMPNGKYAVVCPCASEHESESNKTSTVYCLPNFAGVKYGKFVCMHGHCEGRRQESFLEALGLDPRAVWRQQAGRRVAVGTQKVAGGRIEVTDEGVFFTNVDDSGDEKGPLWICSPLSVVAKTRDPKSTEWGRLLKWTDADGVDHQWAMPLELLQGDGIEVRRELTRRGLAISPNRFARDQLAVYIQTWPVENRARCVDRLGWQEGVYVTPSETIGEAGELVVFQNTHALQSALGACGTTDQWREQMAALAQGNSRLVFALSVAFAAPLANLAGEDSGGFHLRGGSSSGKTTALKGAASVWGNPSSYPRLWRATANGLEGLAALHNDGLLILDELSQCDPKEAGEAAYLLANGQGKTRAAKTGTARPSASWRLLVLSAGEESLAGLMAKAGRKPNAGQEIRLADIEADAGAGMGVFEELHHHPTPAALAQALKETGARYYGAVGVEWLRWLVAERERLVGTIVASMQQFVSSHTHSTYPGQALRVARRFALVATAGELATSAGLTGWKEGEATQAAAKCFSAWLDGFGGTEAREDRALFEQVRAFFEKHGSSRFEPKRAEVETSTDLFGDLPASNEAKVINRAGFYQMTKDGVRQFFVLPEAFKEICQGFERKAAERRLMEAGWIIPGGDKRPQQKPRLPGCGATRCYVFSERLWDEEAEDRLPNGDNGDNRGHK